MWGGGGQSDSVGVIPCALVFWGAVTRACPNTVTPPCAHTLPP